MALPMRILRPLFLAICALGTCQGQVPAQPSVPGWNEINTVLMETTFMIVGPSARLGEENLSRCGTGFVLARSKGGTTQLVLITAKHVFEDIRGDEAAVKIRIQNSNGERVIKDATLAIRSGGKPLYTAHETQDVAAIDFSPERGSMLDSTERLGTVFLVPDEYLESIELHPGDEMLTLGFPFCNSANDAGYPVLRSGKLASYPILPTRKFGKPLFDFRVYPGNSGGPVYFYYPNRMIRGDFKIATVYRGIFGLVTEKVGPQQGSDPELGIIVPAVFIREVIDKLSEADSKTSSGRR